MRRLDDIDQLGLNRTIEALVPEQMGGPLQQELTLIHRGAGAAELSTLGVSASFTMINPLSVEWLRSFSVDRVKGINDTTRDAIRSTLLEGFRAGEGKRELAKRIQRVMRETSKARAASIAITEANHAANVGVHAAQVISGVVSERRWIATLDARVRPNHAKLHNKTAKLHEPFRVGSYSPMRPGAFGVAKEDVNCRCTTIAVVHLDGEDRFDEAFQSKIDAHFERMAKAEARVERIARAVFSEQSRLLTVAARRFL